MCKRQLPGRCGIRETKSIEEIIRRMCRDSGVNEEEVR